MYFIVCIIGLLHISLFQLIIIIIIIIVKIIQNINYKFYLKASVNVDKYIK
jgi:hypothetical protein